MNDRAKAPEGKNPAGEPKLRTDGTGEDFDPVCNEDPYPRYEPKTYEAECVGAQTYMDPQFRCRKCRLEFQIVGDQSPVFCFLNLGSGEKPEAGPRSEYRRAWIIANGARPQKRQRLSKRVFVGKCFEVQVGDVTKRSDGRPHSDAEVYSVVKQIICRTYP